MKSGTKVLIDARGLIEHVGWCQKNNRLFNQSTGDTVAYCAMGAVLAEVDKNTSASQRHSAVWFLGNVLKERGYRSSSIVDFNDTHGRSKREVLELFTRAIELSLEA